MTKRPKISEFQNKLRGLMLGHGTSVDLVPSIREKGLIHPYNYACVETGWEMHDDKFYNVQFLADHVLDRTYPDPEGQWGDHFQGYSMEALVQKFGLDGALDQLEQCLSGKGWMEEGIDDPNNANLVVICPVPPSCLLFNWGNC